MTGHDRLPAIEAWLAKRVEFHLERPPGSVQSDVDLTTYGLDSIYAFSLIADIEEEMELRVEPAAARDCHTIHALANLLTSMLDTRLAGEVASDEPGAAPQ